MKMYLVITENKKLTRILCAAILYLQADGNYTIIYSKGNKKHLVSKSLGYFEKQLKPEYFNRCNDKFMVNLSEVMVFEDARCGYAVLSDGNKIPVSARKKQSFLDAFNAQ